MSYHVFFAFSTGLSKPIKAPIGTLAKYISQVEGVEQILGLKRTQFQDNPVHWDTFDPAYRQGFPDVDNELLCSTIDQHNNWVRYVYQDFAKWQKTPPDEFEEITPKDAQKFWPGLSILNIAPDRWTDEFYRDRMEYLYHMLRGSESEGAKFDAPELTPKQAGSVIHAISEWLDPGDMRLEVPNGRDFLCSGEDGEYEWCEQCGAVYQYDLGQCEKEKCPLIEEFEG